MIPAGIILADGNWYGIVATTDEILVSPIREDSTVPPIKCHCCGEPIAGPTIRYVPVGREYQPICWVCQEKLDEMCLL